MTTLKIGGPARYFVRAVTETDVFEAFEFVKAKSIDIFVLGGGSNILVSDSGFDGLVLQIALAGRQRQDVDEVAVVTAQAGEDWDGLVQFCVAERLAGLECLSGIPGLVGGTPVQNVGAYGQEVSESILSVRCFDRSSSQIVELENADCGFAYRTSIFNTKDLDRYVVLAVTYRLRQNGEPKIVYKDLVDFFSGRQPTLQETREAVLTIRRAKSMVIDPTDPNSQSAGSFFKNPIVSKEKYEEIAAEINGAVPKFPADAENVKIPAAWLIENSGFHKGYRLGNAGISTRHTLAIINCGGATAAEVLALKDAVQDRVEDKFGIVLRPEPVLIGF